MIRKHKKYDRPRQPFDAERIKSENVIVKKYGLKNKREIWKAKAKLDIIRRQAKKIVHQDEEAQNAFLERLEKLGLKAETTVDVLAFTEEDVLKRRLQTVVMKKGLATALKGARQLITHKHVLVHGEIVNIPSYWVSVVDEKDIKLKMKAKKTKVVEAVTEEKPAEVPVENVEVPKEDIKPEEKIMEVTA